jgi:S-DNA-T family DNA segregation ATPase FtsK/SpoIIIE
MLYKNSTMPDTERYQGAFISAREINNVVSYIIEKNKAYFDQDLKEYLDKADKPKQEEREVVEEGEGSVVNDANADLLKRALALAINAGAISISQVQRRFQIGYIRAAGIIDKMEEYGYISGNEGSKNRKVYITREQFEEKYGPMSD